jgi:transposase-like protein
LSGIEQTPVLVFLKFRRLLRYFAQDLSATDAARLTGLTRKTVNAVFLRLRQRIAQSREQDSPVSTATRESITVNDGAPPSSEGNGIDSAKIDSRLTATMEHVAGSEGSRSENFQGFVKGRMQKFKGVAGRTVDLHLKECEWRYNRQHSDLYTELLDLLKDDPL